MMNGMVLANNVNKTFIEWKQIKLWIKYNNNALVNIEVLFKILEYK